MRGDISCGGCRSNGCNLAFDMGGEIKGTNLWGRTLLRRIQQRIDCIPQATELMDAGIESLSPEGCESVLVQLALRFELCDAPFVYSVRRSQSTINNDAPADVSSSWLNS
jgi:hypothetical protein